MTHAPLAAALPFWLSLGLLPLAALAATLGGWWFLLMPLYAWFLTSVLDLVLGLDERNPDPQTPQARLRWHRAITLIWAPLQAAMIFGGIWYAAHGTLSGWEKLGLFFGIGVASGSVGIVYAHELVHQRNRLERWLGDLLLASVLYSHFRSEHLLVHHAWVGTPRDAVTARYNEGFYRFFLRVLRDSPRSAWQAEAGRLRRSGRSALDRRNPFWRYGALQLAMLGLAAALGGWQGVALFVWQALVAVWQLDVPSRMITFPLGDLPCSWQDRF